MTILHILAWYQNPKKHLILAQFSNSPWTGASSVDEKAPDARYGHYEDLLPAWESFGDNL
jgi:hypothetical protein